MPKNTNRGEGVTYVGPRAFAVAFCALCGVFLAVFFGVGRLTDQLGTATPDTAGGAAGALVAGGSSPRTVAAESPAGSGPTVTRTLVPLNRGLIAVPVRTSTPAPHLLAKMLVHQAPVKVSGLESLVILPATQARPPARAPSVVVAPALQALGKTPAPRTKVEARTYEILAKTPARQAIVKARTYRSLVQAPAPPIVVKASTLDALVKAPGPRMLAKVPTLRAPAKAPEPLALAQAPAPLASPTAPPARARALAIQEHGRKPIPPAPAARTLGNNRSVPNLNAPAKYTVGAAPRITPVVRIRATRGTEQKRAATLAPTEAKPDESRGTAKQLLVPFERTTTALTSGRLTPKANPNDALVITAAMPIVQPLSAAPPRP